MENGNISNPKKKISSINTESIVINESDYSEINDKTPIETLGISMTKEQKKKKKKEIKNHHIHKIFIILNMFLIAKCNLFFL